MHYHKFIIQLYSYIKAAIDNSNYISTSSYVIINKTGLKQVAVKGYYNYYQQIWHVLVLATIDLL